jgi:membrane protein YqaA with SNARE-associated domain
MAEPTWRRRFGHPVWRGILRGTVAIGLGAIALVLCWPGTTAIVVFVLLTLACHGPLSPFLPATFEPILLLYGQLHPPLVVALVAAVASAAAEYVNYYLYGALLGCDSGERVMRSGVARAIAAAFGRQPFLAIWVCAWSPLPDWAARILASHARYPVGRYLLAFVVGRIPKFWLLAAIGMHWMPSGWVLWGVVGASVAVTLLGMRRREGGRWAPPSAVPRVPVVSLITSSSPTR